MRYELELENFKGPLEKLLELIEERKLEITDISLAQVTEDFLRYLKSLAKEGREDEREVRLRLVADFVVVASQLVFIKSKSLLPGFSLTQEEQAEIKELEERLKWYREFRPALRHLNRLWRGGARSWSRPYFLHMRGEASSVFYPGRNLREDVLLEGLRRIFEGFERIALENQTLKEKIVSLEEKIAEVVGTLKKIERATFKTLSGTVSRAEVIITFLAILHLAREKLVLLEQAGHFSDIIVKKK